MNFRCRHSELSGVVDIPGSKSHTIRAAVIAGMAAGRSIVRFPLVSADTLSAARAISKLGAEVDMDTPDEWRIRGCEGNPAAPDAPVDVGNSGTTLRLLLGIGSLLRRGSLTLTGDEQIRSRPAGPLVQSLNDLGADVVSVRNNGCAPFVVKGSIVGGSTSIEAATSQYVSSLLLACPLAPRETVLRVPLLNERPYVQMTLDWLARQNVDVEHDDMRVFRIPGGNCYSAFESQIPGDFSSAAFFLGAGALGTNEVTCAGLDLDDPQADKAVVDYLKRMGAEVTIQNDQIRVSANRLNGVVLDLNATPDALPVMAVLGCFAKGETRLVNVAHARLKETDRIKIMACELRKMGAEIEEHPDGLTVRQSHLTGGHVDGHGDHRVVMALALAGLNCPSETVISTAESAKVTFPGFADLMQSLGGRICREE